MKKILLFVFIFIFSLKTLAQLDREHWFAPMVDRTGNGSQYQTLYLSTNEVTPFNVDIYNNNIVIGTVTISKNNPGKYPVNRNYIIANSTNTIDLFKPSTKGLYLKGEKPFYSSLRFSVLNHGEILTSKGTAGIGISFRAVMAPISANNAILNFMTSIMATEDNTSVTINEFNSGLAFSDGISRTQFTFTLNKGQSYIIDGKGNVSQNWTGFIGAKIVSDKPVSITNGNFNGQYATTSNQSSDILMDQGVPIDKLGQEFVLMKGNGDRLNGMERAIVVATENNTQIYLNGASIPAKTLNAGEHYVTEYMPASLNPYILQGSNHYNMHIRTTKNVYVYQLLAGDPGASELATGGFNYIPPLSCYLPKKIDEIGYINENQYVSNNASSLTVPTKLNIITEKGATIKVERNGVDFPLTSADGPYNVTGNSNWVTYSISRSALTGSNSVSGNFAVFSTNAVTAGISAGNDAVGYGGYFAGFSYIPAIIKQEGDCLPGVKLSVTEGFTTYQWVVKNSSGTYVPAPGVNNTNIYDPPQAGIYAVKIQQGSCPEIQTQDFKFYNCTTYTNTNYDICSTEIITPALSLSTQAYNPTTVKIDTPPTQGTATVGTNGKITYTANPGATGEDTFRYSYCGSGAIPDCEIAQATIQINQIVGQDDILRGCTSNGIVTYDLRNANVTSATSVTKVYYKTLIGAQNQTSSDVINNFAAYSSADTNVYVRITNAKNCFVIQKIELKSKANPVVQENLYTILHCDEEDGILDNSYIVNPNDITTAVLVNPATFNVKYYDSLTKANAGAADNIVGNYVFNAPTSIWIRVESSEGCITIKEIALKIGNKISLITSNLTADVCDKSFDNVETVSLSSYLPQLTSAASPTALFYKTMSDAINGQNNISDSQTLSMGVTETYYYVIKNASLCSNVATVNLKLIMGGQASTTLPASVTICEGTTTQMDAGSAHIKYQWFDENDPTHAIPSTQKVILGVGKYHVILTSANGCEYKQSFEIIGSPKAVLNIAALNSTYCDNDLDNQIKIKFSTDVTPVILQNSTIYTTTYYKASTYSNADLLPDSFTFSANNTVYVKVHSSYCSDVFGTINFKVGARTPLVSSAETIEVCDDNLDGIKLVQNLDDYKSLFTNDPSVTAKFYTKKTDAQAEATNNITEANVNQQQILYVRLINTTDCVSLAELTVKIKVPLESKVLLDKTICPEDKTDLDAGIGFTKYEWYKESDPVPIGHSQIQADLEVGKYFVILTSPNGCTYKQNVEIKAAELPVIESIEISGSNVKVNVKGGVKPYRYALDSGIYQDSNVFSNVSSGLHTMYVISADNCTPVEKDFSVVEIYNLITPNGDGVNDVLDMSLLKYKIDVKFQIFDREGKKLFEGDTNNNYIWEGKQGGKVLPTSSYWYIMEWKDFATSTPVKYTGWILLKNRNSD